MSLSQASSPEEVKRDIKLQVFLAMNNKFSHSQTDKLIEDVNKVTNDIMGNPSSDDCVQGKDGYYRRESTDKITLGTKPHIFIGGRHDGDMRLLTVDSNLKPHKESIGLLIPSINIPNASNARAESITTIYYRHKLTVKTNHKRVSHWFYCDEKDISRWAVGKMLDTLDRVDKFFADNMEDPMNNI